MDLLIKRIVFPGTKTKHTKLNLEAFLKQISAGVWLCEGCRNEP